MRGEKRQDASPSPIPIGHHDTLIAKAAQRRKIVEGGYQRRPLPHLGGERCPRIERRDGIEPVEGLVQNDDRGRRGEGDGNRPALPHSRRRFADRALEQFRNPKRRPQLLVPTLLVLDRVARQFEHGPKGEKRRQRFDRWRKPGGPCPRGSIVRHLDSADPASAGGDREPTPDRAQKRGLAGTVGADDTQPTGAGDGSGEPLDDDARTALHRHLE